MSGSVLIIGAGMSGVAAARHLQDAGVHPVLVDKSFRPGGRMATRTVGEARYDHGAQYFTARIPRFTDLIEELESDGVVVEWFRDPERRLAGSSGMRSIVEHLAAGLEIITRTRVDRLETGPDSVTVFAGGALVASGSGAILTPPLPQTLELLRTSALDVGEEESAVISSLSYDPCLTVMARLETPSQIPEGHFREPTSSIGWIGDNHHKGISLLPAVTIQSTPEFARLHLEDDTDLWLPILVEEAERALGQDLIEPIGHRWRYSLAHPTGGAGINALRLSAASRIFLAGDAFGGGRVEGAFASGVAAAELLLESGLV